MTHKSTHNRLSPLAHDAVRWKPGFWGDLHTLCRDTVLPSMRNALNDDSNGAHFINFYLAAATSTKRWYRCAKRRELSGMR